MLVKQVVLETPWGAWVCKLGCMLNQKWGEAVQPYPLVLERKQWAVFVPVLPRHFSSNGWKPHAGINCKGYSRAVHFSPSTSWSTVVHSCPTWWSFMGSEIPEGTCSIPCLCKKPEWIIGKNTEPNNSTGGASCAAVSLGKFVPF